MVNRTLKKGFGGYALFRVIIIIINIIIMEFLNPNSYVMHHQFNIQQLYTLPTLYLCVLYLSENRQRLMPLTA
jgi:hypothetical protein